MYMYYFYKNYFNFVLIKIQLPSISKNQINFPTRNTNKAIQLSTFSPSENGLKKGHSHKDLCHCNLIMLSTSAGLSALCLHHLT